MLTLNSKAPDFSLQGVEGGTVRTFSLAGYRKRWVILFFYPADFTFVCPTEVRGFEARSREFKDCDCQVVGISVDDLTSHKSWAEELGGLSFPLLSDAARKVCRDYGVLDEADGRAFRATFIISPEGTIAWATVSPMNVGRSVDETFRVLKALQTNRLCPADWRPGEPTLDPGLKY